MRKAWLVFQFRYSSGPLVRNHGRHRIAAFGDLNRGLHQIRKRQFAVTFVQGGPTGYYTGDGDRINATLRCIRQALFIDTVFIFKIVNVPGLRGIARRVQTL